MANVSLDTSKDETPELMDQPGKRKFDLPPSYQHQLEEEDEEEDEEIVQWQFRYISLFQ